MAILSDSGTSQGTDLPTKKLVGKGSKIYSRSFIEYDEDTIPIKDLLLTMALLKISGIWQELRSERL